MEESLEFLVEQIKEEWLSPSAASDTLLLPSAYETAWVALVPHPQHPRRPKFPKCLDWVLRNQRDEGFWGEPAEPTIYHLNATLACIVALKSWNLGSLNIEKGLEFLRTKTEELLKRHVHVGIPRGFALVFPAMLELTESKGLEVFPEGYAATVKDVFAQRERILKTEDSFRRGQHSPLWMYLEGLPINRNIRPEAILEQQSEDGSLFRSPSATACAFMITEDRGCMEYLEAMVQRCGCRVPPTFPVDQDLIKLCQVDHLKRLGCGEHFTEEIRHVMDHAYWDWVMQEPQVYQRHSSALQIYKDSLTFQLLRRHGYRVSPRKKIELPLEGSHYMQMHFYVFIYALSYLDDKKCLIGPDDTGRFCWFIHDKEMLSHMEENFIDFLGAMLSVYRASLLMFPQEIVLQDARIFCEKILLKGLPSEAMKEGSSILTDIQKEIQHELRFPWLARMDHLEHRMYIECSKGYYKMWIGKEFCCRLSCSKNANQLAVKNFMIRQSIYREELKELKRWSKEWGLSNMGFGRENTTYCYFSAAVPMSLPLQTDVRKVIAKSAILVTVADDFFDETGSLHELQSLTEAVQRWEGDGLVGHSKVIFDALVELVHDIAVKSYNQQGHDVTKIVQDIWREAFESWLMESKWSNSRHAPSIQDYLDVGKISIAVQAMLLPSCYLTSPQLPETPTSGRYSKIAGLTMILTRLLNDTQSYQKEQGDGKLNLVLLYQKDNPNVTIADSVTYIRSILENKEKEFLELLMDNNYNEVPEEWKQLYLSCLKAFQMFYSTTNAFDSPTAMLQNISQAFYDPLIVNIQTVTTPQSPPRPYETKENKKWFRDNSYQKDLLPKAKYSFQEVEYGIADGRRTTSLEVKQTLAGARPKRWSTLWCLSSNMAFTFPRTTRKCFTI